MSEQRFVIIGGGLAGAKAAEALREQGFDGRLALVGDELHLPYERPPLSKDHLMGKADRDSVRVHPATWYDERVSGLGGFSVNARGRLVHHLEVP